MSVAIHGSVGANGKNDPIDVRKIQAQLNAAGAKPPLVVDGLVGPKTLHAIREYQKQFMAVPDGRVDVNGKTLAELNKGHKQKPTSHGSASRYEWPLAGHIRVTCEFGSRDAMHNDKNHPHGHGGMDLAAGPGTRVLAARAGKVQHSGPASGYGHWVVLRHEDGELSIYGHLSRHHLASVGKHVEPGEVIGLVGTSSEGHTTGPHLHFQINRAGTGVGSGGAINPRTVLPRQH
ncbi:MAG: peptidoglycan DD-metalloendopeptidase family protein [Gemmataceae bacterium]